MAAFTFTSPQGKSYTVNGPDGATPEQAFQVLQSQLASTPDASPSQPPTQPSTQQPASFGQRFLRGVGELSLGPGQLVSDAAGVVGNITGNQTLAQRPEVFRQAANEYRAQSSAMAPQGTDWARLGGQIAGTLPLAELKIVQGAGKIPALINAASQGAASGALTDPNSGRGAAVGAVTGALVPPALQAVGRGLKSAASPLVDKAAQLTAEGINLTPGMAMGNTAKTLEDKLTSIPILGSAIANSQKKSIGEFNTATINKALAPIGKALPKGLSGRDAIAYLHDATSNAYTTILNRVGTVQADAPFIQDMAKLQANIGNMVNTTPEIRAKLQNIVQDEVLNKLPPNGQLEATLFKQIDSRLGSFSREFKGQNNVYANDAGGVVGELRQSLRDMLRRAAPEEAGALDAADRAFAIRSRITQAASSLGANEGVFTPAQLLNAVKSGDKSKGKRAFAQGDALLQDFADRAKSVMGSKYPDSGTAGRGILAALVTGGAGVTSPVGTAAGLTAASLPYLPFMRLTASEVSKIPAKSVQKLGQLSSLLGQSPVTAVTTAPVANQLFQPKP